MTTPRRERTSKKAGPSKEELAELEKNLQNFYGVKENADKVLPILKHSGLVSGRLLEFFVVTFSKQNKV